MWESNYLKSAVIIVFTLATVMLPASLFIGG